MTAVAPTTSNHRKYRLERLRKLYHRLRAVEQALQPELTASRVQELKNELAEIDKASMDVSIREADIYFMLQHRLDRVRSRIERFTPLMSAPEN